MKSSDPLLQIRQITELPLFTHYQPGIEALLALHQDLLLDDLSKSEYLNLESARSDERSSPGDILLGKLLENTQSCMPTLWMLCDTAPESKHVYALATLTQIIPGRHAYLHGVTHPAIRKHQAITLMALTVLESAFRDFSLMKVKAEFEADNLAAKGFCQRLGFHREALFRQDIPVNHQLKDVAVYSLTSRDFQQRLNQISEP